MKSLLIQTFCLLFLCLGTVRAQQYQLASPNGKLSVTVDAGEALTWQIAHDGTTVLQPSAIALQGRDEKSAKKAITFGKNVKSNPCRTQVRGVLLPHSPSIKKQV